MSREYIGCAFSLHLYFVIFLFIFRDLNDLDLGIKEIKKKKKEGEGRFSFPLSSFLPLISFVLLVYVFQSGEETLHHQFLLLPLGYLLLPSSSQVQERLTLTNCKFEMHNSWGKWETRTRCRMNYLARTSLPCPLFFSPVFPRNFPRRGSFVPFPRSTDFRGN